MYKQNDSSTSTFANNSRENLTDILEQATISTKDLLQQFANTPNFSANLKLAFSNDIDTNPLEESWKNGEFVFPEIEIVSRTEINNAHGAFAQDTNKVYLAQEFLLANKNNLDLITSVVLEEYGHFVDSQLNNTDTPGDEGAIFAAVVQGEELSNSKLQQLKNEDDGAVVIIDGEEIVIEQAASNLINGLGGDAGFGENFLERNDDQSTELIDVTSVFEDGLNFFGTNYQGFYINNNGNITFNSSLSEYTPFAITGNTGVPLIAPFFADVDTGAGSLTPSEGGNSTGSNLVYWDLDPAANTVTITWDDVGAFPSGEVPNAFQLILQDLGSQNFQMEFRYEEIQWTVGTASDEEYARVGYSAADGENFLEIPQSGNNEQILQLETASNVNQPGRYVFSVINGIPQTGRIVDGLSVSDIHRFYQYEKGFHLYTSDANEIQVVLDQSAAGELAYSYEAEKYTVLTDNKDALTGETVEGVKPVYRFFNTETGAHLYTMDENEKGYIQDNLSNYSFEGIKYYAFESEPEDRETVPVFRMLNGQSGAHLFTIDQNEINYIEENLPHFSTEGNGGIAFHVFEL